LLFKFDFNPTESDTQCEFRLKTQDKFLYEFMRFKIIDKANNDVDPTNDEKAMTLNQRLVENNSITTINACQTERITFQPNKKGYSLICETIPPYDVFSLNLDLEMVTNKEELELERIELVEPVVYSDVYKPYKYAIIFKEKIYVGQHTSAAFYISLKKKFITKTPKRSEVENSVDSKDGEGTKEKEEEFEVTEEVGELKKNFKVEIFDNNQLISTYHGNGHICISHFNFRGNQGLEEKPKEDLEKSQEEKEPAEGDEGEMSEEKEYKHYYVVKATFDKNDWKEAILKDHEETNDIKWYMRVFSSDTLAVVRDTDKEDREQALKDSWEAAEPGRAEKSRKSRLRYLAQLKQEKGEELTEEEKDVLNERRVRGVANLGEAIPDPKAAKGKADKKAPVQEEEEKVEEVPQEFPKFDTYTNLHFREFIRHFESSRLIHMKCDKPEARLRTDEELAQISKEREEEIKAWENVFSNRLNFRETEKADRDQKVEQLKEILKKSRKEFIQGTAELFQKRNGYREKMSNKKYEEMMKALEAQEEPLKK
jgi:hypothetical protein